MVLVSACLLGRPTRYDGRHSLDEPLARELQGRRVLALCPEVASGLGVPRAPARYVEARPGSEGSDLLAGRTRIVNAEGRDVSREFIGGARAVAARALAAGVRRAYLKDRSPSCGYDPRGVNPQGGVRLGVLAALLIEAGVEVIEVRAAARDDAALWPGGDAWEV